MELFLHPPDDPDRHRPDRRGRLSSVGHGTAFRAFAGAATNAGVRFMVIGGTYRDVAIRAASTRDIDIVLIDAPDVPADAMAAAGFRVIAPHAWSYALPDGREVRLEVAATASSHAAAGPFSVAFKHATRRTIEGVRTPVPRLEDYVILKLLAAEADRRRRPRDLVDVQYALDAARGRQRAAVTLPALRARLRSLYGVEGERLKGLMALLRQIPRAR